MQADKIRETIEQNSLFNSLNKKELEWINEKILPRLKIVEYNLGEDVISAGDRNDSFYIIAEGKARVIDRRNKKNITLAVLERGNSFGEYCLLSLKASPVTIRASDRLTLLKLNRIEFDCLKEKFSFIENKLKTSIIQQEEFGFFRTLKLENISFKKANQSKQFISFALVRCD